MIKIPFSDLNLYVLLDEYGSPQGISYHDKSGFFKIKSIKALLASATLDGTEELVTVDCTSGNVTVTLPAANYNSKRTGGIAFSHGLRIKRLDSSVNTVTVAAAGSDTIDAAATASVGVKSSVDLETDNVTNWSLV